MKKLLIFFLFAAISAQAQYHLDLPGPYWNKNATPGPSEYFMYDPTTLAAWVSTSAVLSGVPAANRYSGQQFIVGTSPSLRYQFRTASNAASGVLSLMIQSGGGITVVNDQINLGGSFSSNISLNGGSSLLSITTGALIVDNQFGGSTGALSTSSGDGAPILTGIVNSSTTSKIIPILQIIPTNWTAGTAIGAGYSNDYFLHENGTFISKKIGQERFLFTDVTNGAGYSKWTMDLLSGGSVANVFEIDAKVDKRAKFAGPVRLATYATGSLPTASSHPNSIAYDNTTNTVKFSNGTAWADIETGGNLTVAGVNGEAQTNNGSGGLGASGVALSSGDIVMGIPASTSGSTRTIQANGSATNVGIIYAPKGTGNHQTLFGDHAGSVYHKWTTDNAIDVAQIASNGYFQLQGSALFGSAYMTEQIASNGTRVSAVYNGSTSTNTIIGNLKYILAGTPATTNTSVGFGDTEEVAIQGSNSGAPVIAFTKKHTMVVAGLSPEFQQSIHYSTNSTPHWAIDKDGLSLFSNSRSYGSGSGVLFIADATTAPSTSVTGGGIIYTDPSTHMPYWWTGTAATAMTGGGGGGGSVTTVSVVTANGISGSVATATTTPAITLTLGAITPSTVNGVTISGSSTPTLAITGTTAVSGTNTGDQTSVTGNAGTATALQTSRTINGTSFNGTANITVTADASTLTGTTLNSTVVSSSLTSLGTVATGTWQATAVAGQYGGTGVNNSGKTITLGGNLTTSGAFATTFTVTATTSVTLPTSGTLLANPMTSVGDLIQGAASGVPARLASVATGNVLISGGVTTASSWGKVGLTTHITGTLGPTNGGTNQSSWTTGDMLIASATNTLAKIAIGTTNQSWMVISGLPAWSSVGVLDINSTVTTGSTITLDCNSQFQRAFSGASTFATGKTMAVSNITNTRVFDFMFEITNVAATLTLPSIWLMSDANFNTTTRIWTPASTGKYEMSGTYDGTNWRVKIAGPFL